MKVFLISTFAVAMCAVFSMATLATQGAGMKNSLGMEFVKIAPGEFMMGCSTGDDNCNDDEKPQHQVRITKAFEMGKYEVTQAQFRAGGGMDQSDIKGDNEPVENVTKDEALNFIKQLNTKNDGYLYRLPTEAEWEYAARAGTTGPHYGTLTDIAWFAENSDDTHHPVGGKKPNAWGLYDMLGNVREWTADVYVASFYQTSPADDPTGPPPDTRNGGAPVPRGSPGVILPIIRGGGWPNPAKSLRVSERYHYYGPTLRVSEVGFRVVRQAQ
ncbi:MAG TPA: formylglycine-generating enzyme family protein [Terriglobia bacterium]|nr:formylglycine-generating enzyme family protein [Terriglobia bacterium]